jgi:transcriptional regulator with GAF, ATPase, and Fis domain
MINRITVFGKTECFTIFGVLGLTMDDNIFFKQATLLICSSLEIETALQRCLQFISKILPADWLHLNIFEPAIGGLRYIAAADATRGWKMTKIIHLPEDLIRAIESGHRLTDHMIINRPEMDPIGRIVTSEFDLPESSFIAQRMRIEGQRLGVVDLFARGHDRYTPEHARRFALLREPFAIAMANALKHQELVELKERLISDNHYLNSELLSQSGDAVIGSDTGLAKVMGQVRQVTHLSNTVLLLGETGTGKEVIANAIHRMSPRSNEAFIKINCGAIPESLIDSELFGHEKGAFTGADKKKRGRFERANKGTLFLDEIGELPPWAQVRLLRALQTQEIERLGGSPPIKLDIRVIVATHRNLEKMVTEGTFREDLWFRINAFPIEIPPLNRRKKDIPLLVNYFLSKKSKEFGIHPTPVVTRASLELLGRHTWPGNVRELENAVERALIQHRHGPLSFDQIIQVTGRAYTPPPQGNSPEPQALDDVMRDHIEKVLVGCRGKVNGADGAAVRLGIHPNTLRNRMKKLGIVFGRMRA